MRPAAAWLVPAMLAAAPLFLAAYREGPLPAMTGGFGEPTCHTCHFDNPENAPGGALRISGVPAAYAPGQDYVITVSVRRPAVKRAGFELAVRFADPPHKGEQAGVLRANDARTQIVYPPDHAVQYIQHNKAGSLAPTPGANRWTVTWTAPAQPFGRVLFNVAANASNDDESPLGDFIYSTAISVRSR